MPISPKNLAAIHRLWDELADFPVAQTNAALLHLLKTICVWTAAGNGLWIGGVRMHSEATSGNDPQYGWRARMVCRLVETPQVHRQNAQTMRAHDADPGLATRKLAQHAGVFRVHRLHDGFIDAAAFKRTPHHRLFYQSAGISDRLWVVFPVNQDTESYFVFDRVRARRRFQAADAELAAYVLRGIKWFHRHLLLSHGLLVAQNPLTPTEHRVLQLLLTSQNETICNR